MFEQTENVSLTMIWSKVIGQERLKSELEHLILTNQVPHSQLFTGSSGFGPLPLAIEFSLFLLQAIDSKDILKGLGKKSQHPDLHFVFPVVKKGGEKVVYSHDYADEWYSFLDEQPYGDYTAWFKFIQVKNKQGIISVAEIKNLHQKMYLKSFGGKGKVCILWGVEKMNAQASNAFLKLLEEPPLNTYFILIAENPQLLLPTLVSRCQNINFGPIDSKALLAHLPKTAQNSKRLLTQAEGDYNRLINMIHESQNKEYEGLLIFGLRKAFKAKGNKKVVKDLIDWSLELSELGREEQKAFLSYGIQFFRDAFLLNYSLQEIVQFRSQNNFDLSKLAPYVHSQNIKEIILLFEQTHYYVLRNGSPKMLFSELALKLTGLINLPVK